MKLVSNPWLNTFAFTGYSTNENQIVVSFRGTNGKDYKNWITNAVVQMLEYENVPGAMVHRGFKGAYDFISKSIRQNVKDLIKDHPTAKILVTGHSLGGSLALLGAVDLKRELGSIKNQIQIYTFGAPRVGNIEFADYVSHLFADVNYIRVTHYDDAIPHIPWTS